MEIRNNAESLKAFLGVSAPGSTHASQVRSNEGTGAQAALDGDQATLSRAGTEVSESATTGGFRADKVAAIQQALAAGAYNVPAAAIAGKVIDTMLEGGIGRGA
jgi:flagellar biosynthesis anti-sigma factor FlgM